jgi:hypothetical protein
VIVRRVVAIEVDALKSIRRGSKNVGSVGSGGPEAEAPM